MRILSITAGAANMYCGSCLRDNALARELMRQGMDVSLVPMYTPTKTDEPNASDQGHVLFGGISVYLQQKSALFRHTPRFLDRLWDSTFALRAASKRSLAVDPGDLGSLTVAMLEGETGPLAKEFHKLEDWLRTQPRPDVINLPNALLIAMAPAIRQVYDGPIVCTLQGEDLFLDGLQQPYQGQAKALIARHASHIDAFISISEFYTQHMSRDLNLPLDRMHYVPLGIDAADFQNLLRQPADDGVFRLGYLARIAPEKGLHFLAEAWMEFRRLDRSPARLDAAGYLAPEHRAYLREVVRRFEQAGLAGEFRYHGEVDREEKLRFLTSLDAFSVPATYDEPKGLYVLEAMAAGVPVIAPDRGVYREHLRRCRGGLLFEANSPKALAQRLSELRDVALRTSLGKQGQTDVFANATLQQMASRTIEVYAQLQRTSADARRTLAARG